MINTQRITEPKRTQNLKLASFIAESACSGIEYFEGIIPTYRKTTAKIEQPTAFVLRLSEKDQTEINKKEKGNKFSWKIY